MNKIIYNLVYNRKKCLNKKGMALVQVEAYLGRKKKYFSTKVYLKPEQWDNKKLIVKNHPNADALNRLIYEFVATIEKKELELWQQGKRISLELLKNALTTQENNSSFISFFRQEVMNSSLKDMLEFGTAVANGQLRLIFLHQSFSPRSADRLNAFGQKTALDVFENRLKISSAQNITNDNHSQI